MGRIVRRPAAKRDLIGIYQYVAEDAPQHAGALLEKIDQKLHRLSDQPFIGVARLDSFPEIRVFPVGNYLIIYQPLPHGDGIELIRIIHAMRDWELLIEGDL